MSSYANLLIGSGTSFDLYHYNGGSNVLYDDLFWGPVYAESFIRSAGRMSDPDWLDEMAADGGAVMDLGCRVVIWFGGEHIEYDVPLRRAYLRVMSRLWSGWTVHWATGGMADLADYVGRPRASVLWSKFEPAVVSRRITDPLLSSDEPNQSDTVMTARTGPNDIRAALLVPELPDLLYAGPALATAVDSSAWPSILNIGCTGDDYPIGGCHLDIPACTLDFWTASAYRSADVLRRVRACWPGWSVTWHGDRFESQLERAAGHLRVKLPEERDLMRRLRSTMLYPEQPRHPPTRPPLKARTRLFDAVAVGPTA